MKTETQCRPGLLLSSPRWLGPPRQGTSYTPSFRASKSSLATCCGRAAPVCPTRLSVPSFFYFLFLFLCNFVHHKTNVLFGYFWVLDFWNPEPFEFFQEGARIEAAFRKYFYRADPTQVSLKKLERNVMSSYTDNSNKTYRYPYLQYGTSLTGTHGKN